MTNEYYARPLRNRDDSPTTRWAIFFNGPMYLNAHMLGTLVQGDRGFWFRAYKQDDEALERLLKQVLPGARSLNGALAAIRQTYDDITAAWDRDAKALYELENGAERAIENSNDAWASTQSAIDERYGM